VPVTVAVPGATPVKATEQLPANNVQLDPTLTTAVFDEVKVTEPVGVFDGLVVSVTVTVQVPVCPGATTLGLQATTVSANSCTTEIVFDVPVLPL